MYDPRCACHVQARPPPTGGCSFNAGVRTNGGAQRTSRCRGDTPHIERRHDKRRRPPPQPRHQRRWWRATSWSSSCWDVERRSLTMESRHVRRRDSYCDQFLMVAVTARRQLVHVQADGSRGARSATARVMLNRVLGAPPGRETRWRSLIMHGGRGLLRPNAFQILHSCCALRAAPSTHLSAPTAPRPLRTCPVPMAGD